MPGIYLAIWLRVLSSFALGVEELIFVAGLVKAILLVIAFTRKRTNLDSSSIIKSIVGIHVTVGMLVLLSLLLSKTQISSIRFSALEVTCAFIATETLILPIVGIGYLVRKVRSNESSFATIFLLTAGVYLDVVLVSISNMITTNQVFLNLNQANVLELAGAKINFLLASFLTLTASPAFWFSHSFYSLDVLQIPNWVSGIYVFAMAFYLYRGALGIDFPNITRESANLERMPLLNPLRLSCDILIATVLALALVWAASMIIPSNATGNLIELQIELTCTALVTYFAFRVK
jgi:hypothetical protein